jgi:glycosyltransferase involved in cell wall biosynthesis
VVSIVPPSQLPFGLFADPALQSSAGIERYVRKLIDGIAASPLASRCVLLTTDPRGLSRLLRATPGEGLAVVDLGYPSRALRYAWAAGRSPVERLADRRFAFVHAPTHQRVAGRAPYLATIMDVGFTKQRSLMTVRQRLTRAHWLEAQAIRHAAHLIAISRSTRDDLLAVHGVAPDRVSAIPLAVDAEQFRAPEDLTIRIETLRRYGLTAPFVLYLGSLYPRKLGKLIEAFSLVAHEEPEVELVIAGGRETSNPWSRLGDRIKSARLADRVRLLGIVPDADVPVLMSAATVFAYVSTHEGFGLAPLEAMACGAPVVASRATSLPEVVGNAGLLVDPDRSEEIAAALLRLLRDSTLRGELSRAGVARAAQFSWQSVISRTLEIYRRYT